MRLPRMLPRTGRGRWMAGATLAVASVAVFAGAAMANPGGQGRYANILPQGSSAENGESDDSEKKRLKDRVAEILGIETETLEDAFRQAHEEQFMARRDERLDDMVEDGRLTEDEAAEIREWVEDRPDALWELLPGHGDKPLKRGWHGPNRGPFGIPGLIGTPPVELIEQRVQELEEEGELSEDDAEAIRDWLDDSPDALDKLTPGLDAAGEVVDRILESLVEDGVLSEEQADMIRDHLRSAKEMLKGLDRERPRPEFDSERRGPNAHPFGDEFFDGRPGQGPPSSFEFRGFARPNLDDLPNADELRERLEELLEDRLDDRDDDDDEDDPDDQDDADDDEQEEAAEASSTL